MYLYGRQEMIMKIMEEMLALGVTMKIHSL